MQGFGIGESVLQDHIHRRDQHRLRLRLQRSLVRPALSIFNFSLTGTGVNFANNPDDFRLLFGQTFNMNGQGTLIAGETYTLEIDLYASGDAPVQAAKAISPSQ